MTIQLPKELERFVHDAVRDGHYAREDDVIRDALVRLQKDFPQNGVTPKVQGKRLKSTQPAQRKKSLTIDELHQQMLASGLISRLPDSAADFDDPDDQPITIKGEPLSETIIRERR